MSDRVNELSYNTEPIDVVVMTFSAPRLLKGYQKRFAPDFTVVTDPELNLYHQYGFERGSVARVWGWKSVKKYVSLIRRGHRLETENLKTKEDTLQLGGNVLVGADGIVRWVYAGAGPDDRPSVEEIKAAIEALS